ncbi:unnamed protein product, partial [Rotaria sordida]
MPMTAASMFWLDTLRDYKIDHSLPLPFDRYRLSDEYRTGREMSVSFDFGEDLSHVFLAYSSSNSITALQLALACYYAFLFKLTNGEKDLCIGMNTHGRYKEELMSVIGMFVNTIPLRCQLDPHWSFHQLVEHVKEIITNTLKYSYFPLQRILSQHPNATKPAFIETSFEFQSFKSKSDKKEMMIGNARIIAAPISKNIGEDGIMSNFDFTLTIQHDLDIDQLSCTINASLDLFDRKTIDIITQRFHSMLEQLFNVTDIQMKKPIYEFSLILPNEKFFTKSMNNTQVIGVIAIEMAGGVYCPLSPRDPEHRLHLLVEQTQSQLVLVHHLTKNKFNDTPASDAQARIWLDEQIRFNSDKSLIAIYNMPFFYRLCPGHTLSIQQLRQALQLIVRKHQSLRTSLFFDKEKNQLMQRIIDYNNNNNNNTLFEFIESHFETHDEFELIMQDEKRNSLLFDPGQGLVFRCHILHHTPISSNDLLCDKDAIIFNFHHALFDFPSMDLFLHDLNQAYTTSELSTNEDTILHYLDYATIEQQMSMTAASMFWLDSLHDCNLDHSLPLPFDRYRLSNEHRTGRGISVSFNFGEDLSHDFLSYSSSHSITVIGMMAIEMIGAVYCPLSPRDPEHRLHMLVEQTRSQLVLVHHLTKNKFNDSIISLDIDLILVDNDVLNYGDVNQLLSIVITQENTAYIIFTSGSTGTPKAVPVKHGNFTACMHSLVCIDTFNKDDTVVQMAKCSFDIHVQEILGTLINGASLIMLQPLEIIDFDYLLKVLYKNQISYMHTVPSDTLFPNLVSLIASICMSKCAVWNLYGPAETTIDCTFYRTGVVDSATSIPIGLPLANYRCLIMDDCLQSVVISQEGELYVGGVGIFLGYLRRDDLTAKALLEVDGEIFYRTGDLVRMDNNGFLHYQGRKDHQIKLHGQRIELGEIEQCLLNTSISACVVIKWGDDQLVSYVQSSNINEEQLHKHCQSHLPPHMIPSIFVILEKLPLNA